MVVKIGKLQQYKSCKTRIMIYISFIDVNFTLIHYIQQDMTIRSISVCCI